MKSCEGMFLKRKRSSDSFTRFFSSSGSLLERLEISIPTWTMFNVNITIDGRRTTTFRSDSTPDNRRWIQLYSLRRILNNISVWSWIQMFNFITIIEFGGISWRAPNEFYKIHHPPKRKPMTSPTTSNDLVINWCQKDSKRTKPWGITKEKLFKSILKTIKERNKKWPEYLKRWNLEKSSRGNLVQSVLKRVWRENERVSRELNKKRKK